MEIRFHDLPYWPDPLAGGQDADQKFIDVRMNAVKRKIIVLSGKGGIK